MKYVCAVVIILVVTLTPLKVVSATIPYFIHNAANEFNIDETLLLSLCKVESNCRSNSVNKDDARQKSRKLGIKSGSYGMFQMKIITARSLGLKGTNKQIIKSLLKPEVSSYYAAKYLYKLYKSYKSTVKVLSAYNAGRYTIHNQNYVNKVLRQYISYKIDRNYDI